MANEQIIDTYVSSVTGFNRFVPDTTNAPEVMFTSSGSLFIAGLKYSVPGFSYTYSKGYDYYDEIIATMGEIGTGDGTEVTFSGKLQSTVYPILSSGVRITDGVQSVTDTNTNQLEEDDAAYTTTDEGKGVFEGDASGTIDYSNGVYTVTFNVAPAANSVIRVWALSISHNQATPGTVPTRVSSTSTVLQKVVSNTDGVDLNSCASLALSKWESPVFVAGRNLQSRELNEVVSSLKGKVSEVGATIHSDGDIITGCQVIVSPNVEISPTLGNVYAVTITEGSVYFDGGVHQVPSAVVYITKTGTEYIGLKIIQDYLTDVDDAYLRDPATGFDGTGLPGAWRNEFKLSWVANGEGLQDVFEFQEGNLLNQNAPTIFSKLNPTLARRTNDESGNYKVHGLTGRVEKVYETGTNSNGVTVTSLNDQVWKLVISEGVAYVSGYEVRKNSSTSITYRRAVDVGSAVFDFTYQPPQETADTEAGDNTVVRTAKPYKTLYKAAQQPLYSVNSVTGIARTPEMRFQRTVTFTANAVIDLVLLSSTLAGVGGQKYAGIPNTNVDAGVMIYDASGSKKDGDAPDLVAGTHYNVSASGDSIIVLSAGTAAFNNISAYRCYWNYTTSNGQSPLVKGTRLLKQYTSGSNAYESISFANYSADLLHDTIAATGTTTTSRPLPRIKLEKENVIVKPTAGDADKGLLDNYFKFTSNYDQGNENYQRFIEGVDYRLFSGNYLDSEDMSGIEYRRIGSINYFMEILATGGTHGVSGAPNDGLLPTGSNSLNVSLSLSRTPVKRRTLLIALSKPDIDSADDIIEPDFSGDWIASTTNIPYIITDTFGNGSLYPLFDTTNVVGTIDYDTGAIALTSFFGATRFGSGYVATNSASERHVLSTVYAHGAGVSNGTVSIIPGSDLATSWYESIVNVPSGGTAGLDLRAAYDYWGNTDALWDTNDAEGDFLGPDSYLEESDITGTLTFPNISTATGKKYRVPYERLLDWQKTGVDLRPNASKTSGGQLSITKGWSFQYGRYTGAAPSPAIDNQGQQVTATVGFYQNRYDSVSIAQDGRVEINYGASGSRIEAPSTPIGSLSVMEILQTGNTDSPNIKDTSITRSTMKDIDVIKKRVSNLEEVVAINALESSALSSSRGLQIRGIAADSFTNFQGFDLNFKGPWKSTDTPKWLDGTLNPSSETRSYIVGDRVLPMVSRLSDNGALEHFYANTDWEMECIKSGITAVVANAATFKTFLESLKIGDIWHEGVSTTSEVTGQTAGNSNCVWRIVKKRVPSKWLPNNIPKNGTTGDYTLGAIVRDIKGASPVYFKCVKAGTPGTAVTNYPAFNRAAREGDRIADSSVVWAAIPKGSFDIDMVNAHCGIDNLAECLTLREQKTRNYVTIQKQLESKIKDSTSGLLLYDQTLILGNLSNFTNYKIFTQPMASEDVPINLYNEFEAVRNLKLSPSSQIFEDVYNVGKMTGVLPGSSTTNVSVGYSGAHLGAGVDEEDNWIDGNQDEVDFWTPEIGQDVEPLPAVYPLGSIKDSDSQFQVGVRTDFADVDGFQTAGGTNARYDEYGNIVVTTGNAGNEAYPESGTGIGFVPQDIKVTTSTSTQNLGPVVVSTTMATQVRQQEIKVSGTSWPIGQEISVTINGQPKDFSGPVSGTNTTSGTNGTVLPSTKKDSTWGTFEALLEIPSGTPTGNVEIVCTSNNISKTINFLAVGTVSQTRNLELTQTNTHTEVVGSLCPVAQTFQLVEKEVWATGVAVAFSVPDSSQLNTGDGVDIELRTVINGYPGDTILAKGSVLWGADRPLKSLHATGKSSTSILFNMARSSVPPSHIIGDSSNKEIYFENPVLLYPNVEYALVLLTSVDSFYVWTGKIGEEDLAAKGAPLITSQPTLGSFFNSQNNTTWTADQYRDLSFKLLGTTPSANQSSVTLTFDNNTGIRGARYKLNSTQYIPSYVMDGSDGDDAGIKWEVSWNNGSNWSEILPKAKALNMTKVMDQAKLRLTMKAGKVGQKNQILHSPSINPERVALYAFSDTGMTLSLDDFAALWPNANLPTASPNPSKGGIYGIYVSKNKAFYNGRFSSLRVITEEYRPEKSKLEYFYSVNDGKDWFNLPNSEKDRIANYTDYEQINFGNYIYEATRKVDFNRVVNISALTLNAFSNNNGTGWTTTNYYWVKFTFVNKFGESLPSALSNAKSPQHAADELPFTLPSGDDWPEAPSYNGSRPVRLATSDKIKIYLAETSSADITPVDDDFKLLKKSSWYGTVGAGEEIKITTPVSVTDGDANMPKVNGTLPKQFRIMVKLNAQAESRLIDNPETLNAPTPLTSGGSLANNKKYQVAYTWVYADDVERDDGDIYDTDSAGLDKIDRVIANDPVVSGNPKTYYETAPYKYGNAAENAAEIESANSRLQLTDFKDAEWPENAICALFYIRDVTNGSDGDGTDTGKIGTDTPQWRRATLSDGASSTMTSLKRNYAKTNFYINSYPTTAPILTPPIQNETPGLTANGPQVRALRMIANTD